jgi:geranylgeranyl pyrophosphate synthase
LGDNAGLANPLHGGGIFEARLSAKLAAQAVEEFLAGRLEDPGSYYSGSIVKKIINHTHRWDAIIRRVLISPTPRKKLWHLAQEDPQFKEALSIIYTYSTDHFKPFRIILERVFQKLQQEMEEAIRPYQKRINSELSNLFPKDTNLDRLVNYSLLGPGKRLRASLVCLMGEAMGVDLARALPAALSYELAHTASLVHDDIIDEANKRRGKPTVVANFGMDGAIVSGDALIMKAYEISMSGYRRDGLSKDELIDLVECATRSGLKACSGELLDVKIGREPVKYSVADYIRLVEQKTASLIEGPCEAAAILAGQESMRSAARLFGRYLGIAFQILDDAKDVFASEESSLKGRFADFRSGKPNLYIICVLKKAERVNRERLKKLLARGNPGEEDIQFIYRTCYDTGVILSVKRLFGAYLRKANNMLDRLPDSAARSRLRNLLNAMAYWKNF